MSAKDLEKQANDIINRHFSHGKIRLDWNSVAEAKLHKSTITQVQKELRLVKKAIAAEIKAVNASFASEKAKVGTGFSAGIFGGVFGKKSLGKANAINKDHLRHQQLNARQPYEAVNQAIDKALMQLDQLKLQIDTWIVRQK